MTTTTETETPVALPGTVVATIGGVPVNDFERRLIQGIWDSIVEMGWDYVYPVGAEGYAAADGRTCLYSRADGTPACLIGHGLYRVAPHLMPDFSETEGAVSVLDNREFEGDVIGGEVQKFAFWIQRRQDESFKWGDAWVESTDAIRDVGLVIEVKREGEE